MGTHKHLRLLWPAGLAVLLVILGWAALPGRETSFAANLTSPGQESLPPPSPAGYPESSWSELVRSLEANHQARQPDLVDASLTVHLNLTDGSLAGSAATLQSVNASVSRDGYQVAIGEGLPVPDPAGFFYYLTLVWQPYPCGGDYCYHPKLEPGDQLSVTQGGLSQSISVPQLTALAEPGPAAPGEDSLYGQAPPISELTAYVIPFADPAAIYTQTGSAAGDGSYQIGLSPAHDLHRQDSGYILLELGPGVSVYRRFVAPMLRLQVGGATISGVAAPQADIVITHTLASGEVVQVIQTATSEQGGFSYQTEVADWGADSRALTPGDRVVAAAAGQAFSMTLPVLSAKTHQESGLVSGQAPPGATVEARYFDGPMPLDFLLYGSVDAIWDLEPEHVTVTSATPAGDYTASLPIGTGDYGAVFVTLPDEHQAYARTTTVYIYTRTSDPVDITGFRGFVAGQIDLLLTPITISVRGPSGYLKDWGMVKTSAAGGFNFFGSWLTVDSGDVVEITAPGEELIAFSVPILTATANGNLSTISGSAPPETRLTASVYDGYHDYLLESRVVTSTADGAYTVDFSDSLEFFYLSYGSVSMFTPEGHQVERYWRMSSCQGYLAGAQVGGNRVFVNCYEGMMRLWDAGEALKKEMYLVESQFDWAEGYQLHLYDENGAPIPVLPGDRIEILYQGGITSSSVPLLSAQVDPDTSLVSGTAPAGSRLEIILYTETYEPNPAVVVTATQSGTFQASLGSGYTYRSGDRIKVSISRQPVEFSTIAVLPRLVIPIYSESVYGWLPPLTAYQLSLDGTDTNGSASGYAKYDAYFNATLLSEDGWAVRIKPSDHLELVTPQGMDELTIPDLTARYDPLASRLSGQAPPGAQLEVQIYQQYPELTRYTTAGADGEYQVDFPELEGAQNVQGSLIYHTPAGHQVTLAFSTPHLEVTLVTPCVYGPAPYPSGEVTLSLTSADGAYTRTESQHTEWGSFSICFERGIVAGDRLKLSNPEGVLVVYLVPQITARYDYSGQVLLGSAPPGSAPAVEFGTEVYPFLYPILFTRYPLQEADGSFGVDTSDLPLKIGNWGKVTVKDSLGNLTQRNFTVSGNVIFLPQVSREASP